MEPEKEWMERRSGSNAARQNDARDPYERDRARMIHSASFRRLQSKTQVLGVGESDFYRTRLTHSLEVAQIGSGIVQQLLKNKDSQDWVHYLPTTDLITTICLGHDLGHPPFGHGGEVALNYMMRDHGGFEGNGQTLRIISKLDKYTGNHGMDLTRRSMLGMLKYPILYSEACSEKHKSAGFKDQSFNSHRQIIADEWKPPKCCFDEDRGVLEWIISPFSEGDKRELRGINKSDDNSQHHKSQNKSLDTSIMDLSDDIAYGIHDLEDAISLNLVTRQLWEERVVQSLRSTGSEFGGYSIDEITEKLFSGVYYKRKEAVGGLVNWLITAARVHEKSNFESGLLRFNVKLPEQDENALSIIKKFVVKEVIRSHPVQLLEYKGQQMIMAIFESLSADPGRLLPKATIEKWEKYITDMGCSDGVRVVCDYVSGMTDDYATRIYKMLFVAGDGSIFHKL